MSIIAGNQAHTHDNTRRSMSPAANTHSRQPDKGGNYGNILHTPRDGFLIRVIFNILG